MMLDRSERPPHSGVLGLTKTEVMERLKVSGATLYRLLAAKKLTAKKVGSRTIIDAESVQRYWDSLPDATFRAPQSKRVA